MVCLFKLRVIFIELARVVYVKRFRNFTLFPVRGHSERRCSLVFAVNCGTFQGANVPVHWKDFTIETALKMADSLINALTTEQGSRLRRTPSLVQVCYVSHRRISPFAESHRRSIISSSVLKSDLTEINVSRFSVLVIQKPLQPVFDSRTRTALTGTLHVRSVYQLLCSCSSSVLFHTNSIRECIIIKL